MLNEITRRRFLARGTEAAAAVAANTVLPPAVFASRPVPKHQAALEALDAYVREHMRAIGAPGMILALTTRDGVLRVSQYGLADVKLHQPVKPEHLFEIGSITKSFAAICALQFRGEGRLDLNAPVTSYLPWLDIETKYEPISCHHLLSHTSGLADDPPLFPRGVWNKLWTGYPPGSQYSYSNTGYQILGLVLQAIDKRTWAEILRGRIFARLGFQMSEPIIVSRIRPRLATGYSPLQDDRPFPPAGPLGEAPWVDEVEASGSIAATGADMAQYLLMLLNRGRGARGRVLSEESFNLFTKPVRKAASWGENTSYAYGLAVDESDQRVVLRHTGGMVAFSSAMHADITNGFAAFASVNANLVRYRPNAVAHYALDLLRASAAGKPLPTAPPVSGDPPFKANDYVGEYKTSRGRSFEARDVSGKIQLAVGPHLLPLLPAGKDQFVIDDPEWAHFYLTFSREKGQVVEAFHGDDWYTNQRYTGTREFAYPKQWDGFMGEYRNDSPWWGSAQVFLRKGKLWLGDSDSLAPLQNGLFRVGDEEYSPERVSFDGVANGRAMRMNFSGVDFYRRADV